MSLITETWLREMGFRWEQLERQPSKHWILLLGKTIREFGSCDSSDLAIELSARTPLDGAYYCWIRSDLAGRYSRFLHVRYMRERFEVVRLIEALVGFTFDPSLVFVGSLHRPEDAGLLKKYRDRLDIDLAESWGKRVETETGADPDKRELLKP